jgi:hypothetical protein
MRKTVNIDFDNSSSIILGYDPNILGPASTKFAFSTHIHGSVHFDLTNITASATSVSNGLTLALSANSGGGGVGSLYAGTNITLSTVVGSTTISATELAQRTHIHGTPSVVGMLGVTTNSSAWSISIPDFLLTAAQSIHTHNYAGTLTGSASTSGTDIKMTLGTTGLSLGIPPYITTAAQISHTHGIPTGINITIGSSSNALALSVADNNRMGTATSLAVIAGTDVTGVGNTAGLTLGFPSYITTYVAQTNQTFSNQTGNYVFSGFSSTSVHTDGIPYGLSLTAQPGNLISLGGNISTSAAGAQILISSGTALINGGANITLSQDGNAFTIIGAASGAGGGIALSLSTSNTAGVLELLDHNTVYFQGGNNITLSQDAHTINIIGKDVAGTSFVTTATAGTEVTATLDSIGLKLAVPPYITNPGLVGLSISSNSTSSGGGYGLVNAGNIYLMGSDYITLVQDGSSIAIKGAPPAAATNALQAGDYLSSTYTGAVTALSVTGLFPSANTTKFAGTGTSMVNATATLDSVGLNLSVHAVQTGISGIQVAASTSGTLTIVASTIPSGTVQFGNANGISFGIAGSTVTGSWNSNAYLLTAYSSLLQAVSNSSLSFATANSSLLQLTANNSLSLDTNYTSHTHSNLYPPIAGTTYYLTSVLSNTFAQNTHTHSNLYPAISGTTYYLSSNLVNTFALGTHIHGAMSTASTTGTDIKFTSSSSGLTLGVPAYITSPVNRSLNFSDMNGVTFGIYSSSGYSTTITASVNTVAGGAGAFSGVSLGGNTSGVQTIVSSGTLHLRGGNNITLSQNGNSVTISAGASGGAAVGIAGSNASTFNSGTLIFSNSNSVTFGLSGSTMTASIPSGTFYLSDANGISFGSSVGTGTASNQTSITMTHGLFYSSNSTLLAGASLSGGALYMGGNTSGTIVSMLTGTYTIAGGANITLSQVGNAVTISGAAGTLSAMNTSERINYFYTSNNTFANNTHIHGALTTYGTTGTDVKYTSASNGLSLGIPAALTMVITSNTAGTTGSISTGLMRLGGGTNVTLEQSGNIIYLHAGGGAAIKGSGVSSQNTGTVEFANSNSVTFGLNAGTMTASVARGQLYFADSNGISFGSATAGSTTTITAIGGGAGVGSVYYMNPVTTGGITSGSNVTWGSSTNGSSTSIFLTAGGGAGAGGAAIQGSGTYSQNSGTISFANSNGVTFGMSANQMTGSVIHGNIYFTDGNGISFGSANAGVSTSISISSHGLQYTSATSLITSAAFPIASSTRYMGLNTSMSSGYAGSTMSIIGNSSGLTLRVPNWITTAVGTADAHIRGIGDTGSIPFTSGSVRFSGANLTVNTYSTGGSQILQVSGPAIGYLFFSNIAGFSWSSSVNVMSTSVYLVTA